MGIAALVLGIISILIGLFSIGTLGWLGAILGILGIILGTLAQDSKENSYALATSGLVCSIIGTTICLLFYIACVSCMSAL